MDYFLGKVTQQAMNYAIRSGVAITATYAIKQSNRLLANVPKSDIRDELLKLQQRLDHKIKIIAPAIDMIELIAARGNTSLESAINLTRELRKEIEVIGKRLEQAAINTTETARQTRPDKRKQEEDQTEMMFVAADLKKLLERLDDAVPLMNLAITTSGVTLSASLPQTVSPSRLLQASTMLTDGDSRYALDPRGTNQIGPTFNLTVYMLFAGHNRPQNEEDIRETTWKEVIHKARVKLRRVPLDMVMNTGSGSEAMQSADIKATATGPTQTDMPGDHRADEFAYQLMIIEDFDDDRMHDFEDDQAQPGPFDDVQLAGIREMIPIHEVSKIFYADTSKVLNINNDAETNHPVLLLKRDVDAVPPRRMIEKEEADESQRQQSSAEQAYAKQDRDDRNQDPWRLPPSLDPEWIAFEVYTEAEPEEDDFLDVGEDSARLAPTTSLDESISKLNISSPSPQPPPLSGPTKQTSPFEPGQHNQLATTQAPFWANQIKTSLSLLELLVRLTSLQQFQQQSHLAITDELLNFFLEEAASTGAGGNEQYRQQVRADARRRVGWDPYDESPVKRRGEDYQYNGGYDSPRGSVGGEGVTYLTNGAASPGWTPSRRNSPAPEGSGFQTRSITHLSNTPSGMRSPGPGEGSPLASKSREGWLRREDSRGQERKGSPLRPSTGRSDEGLGTSPATFKQ